MVGLKINALCLLFFTWKMGETSFYGYLEFEPKRCLEISINK